MADAGEGYRRAAVETGRGDRRHRRRDRLLHGHLAKSPAAPKVYAVDIEPSMVAYVKQRASREGLMNVVAVQAGADRTNLPEPVDLVLVVDTYHHIPNRVAYFTAQKDRMKAGARLAIVDFRKDSPSGPPP